MSSIGSGQQAGEKRLFKRPRALHSALGAAPASGADQARGGSTGTSTAAPARGRWELRSWLQGHVRGKSGARKASAAADSWGTAEVVRVETPALHTHRRFIWAVAVTLMPAGLRFRKSSFSLCRQLMCDNSNFRFAACANFAALLRLSSYALLAQTRAVMQCLAGASLQKYAPHKPCAWVCGSAACGDDDTVARFVQFAILLVQYRRVAVSQTISDMQQQSSPTTLLATLAIVQAWLKICRPRQTLSTDAMHLLSPLPQRPSRSHIFCPHPTLPILHRQPCSMAAALQQ